MFILLYQLTYENKIHDLFPYLYDQRLKQHMCTFLTKTPVTKSLKNILDFAFHLNNFVDVHGSCSQATASFLWTTVLSVLVYRSYYLMISCDSLSSHFPFPWFYVCASNIVYPSRRIQEQLPSHLSSMYYSIYSDHKMFTPLDILPFKATEFKEMRFLNYLSKAMYKNSNSIYISTKVINWKYWTHKLLPEHLPHLKWFSFS